MEHEGRYRKLSLLVAFRILFVSILLAAFFLLHLGHKAFLYPRQISYLIVAIYVLNIIYLVLLRQKRINPTLFGYVQLSLDIVAEIVLILLTGGIESWFTVTLLLTVISSSIVIDRKAGYAMAVLASILYGVMIDLQYYKIIPIPYSVGLSEKFFLYNIVINLSALYLTAFLIGYMTTGLERTQRSLAEKSSNLKALSLFHKDVIENIPSGLFTSDLSGNITLFNRAAEKISGLTREMSLKHKIVDIFPFTRMPIQPGRYNGVIETDKGTKNIGMSISVYMDEEDQKVGYIGTFQDLTEIVRLENDMKKKEKFVVIGELAANIAHEIRNPLASIRGSIEMIKEGREKGMHTDRLMEIALYEVTRLNNIITDFLNYSNPRTLNFERSDVGNLLHTTLMLLKSSVNESKDIVFHEEIENTLHAEVDDEKLRQVFWNLLKNAVESIQQKGNITVKAWSDKEVVVIAIRDTGEGIKKEDLERIFYPFHTTKKDGTGLGLAIAYRIVDEHNGSIGASSKVGEGTAFTVVIPSKQNKERIPQAELLS